MVSSIEQKSESSLDRSEQTKPVSSFSLERSKVRFSQKIQEYHILSLDSYSERELRHCWYTEEEREKYMDRHERSAKRLEKGERSKRGESFRGLEGWTQDGGEEANEMIADCIDAVLYEQERQWKKHRENRHNLALISESKSKKCVKMAIRIGKRDMKEAIKAYESMGIEDLDLDSVTDSIASLVASSKSGSSSNHSDENELYRPRSTQKVEERHRRTTRGRRSSAYRTRGEHERPTGSRSVSKSERKRHKVPLE